jgi:hypothetical protein
LKLPNTIGGKIRPKILDNEISKLYNAQQDILAHRKTDSHNAQQEVLAHRKIDSHNAQKDILAHRKIDSHNAQKDILAFRKIDSYNALMIGNVISQTAAASNSVKLNKKGPKIDP